jgi:hypothetical protein
MSFLFPLRMFSYMLNLLLFSFVSVFLFPLRMFSYILILFLDIWSLVYNSFKNLYVDIVDLIYQRILVLCLNRSPKECHNFLQCPYGDYHSRNIEIVNRCRFAMEPWRKRIIAILPGFPTHAVLFGLVWNYVPFVNGKFTLRFIIL